MLLLFMMRARPVLRTRPVLEAQGRYASSLIFPTKPLSRCLHALLDMQLLGVL